MIDGQGAEMLGVEPHGLVIERNFLSEIHDSIGAIDVFEGEEAGELVEGEELAVVFGRPAEQAEEVDERVREKSGVAIGGDADDGAVAALGELGAVGGDEQGQMRELRRHGPKAFEDEQVFEGVGEVVLAANDVADRQVGVVHAGRQMISRVAVGTEQGKVFDFVGQLGLISVDGVGEAKGSFDTGFQAARDAVAECERLTRGGTAVALLAREIAHPGIEEPGSVCRRLVAVT